VPPTNNGSVERALVRDEGGLRFELLGENTGGLDVTFETSGAIHLIQKTGPKT